MYQKDRSFWLILALSGLAIICLALFVLVSINSRIKYDHMRTAQKTQNELSKVTVVNKYYHDLLASEAGMKQPVINEQLVNYLLANATYYSESGKYDLAQENLGLVETILHNYEQKIDQKKKEVANAQAAARSCRNSGRPRYNLANPYLALS
jgi:hypothetical protein